MKKYFITTLFALSFSFFASAQSLQDSESLKLSDYRPYSVFKLQEDNIRQAAYPVTDMHSHAYVDNVEDIQQWLKDMDGYKNLRMDNEVFKMGKIELCSCLFSSSCLSFEQAVSVANAIKHTRARIKNFLKSFI